MKILLSVSILLLLQGCIYQSVDEIDIKLSQQLCLNNKGVKRITIFAGVATTVKCKDGISKSFSVVGKDHSIENEKNNLANKK